MSLGGMSMQEKDGPKLLGPHSGVPSRVANMQGPILLEPICPHELPSPLGVFRVPWLRSQLPLLVLLRSTPWPSKLGGHCPLSRMRKLSAGWGIEHQVGAASQWVLGRVLRFCGFEPLPPPSRIWPLSCRD